ncbi:MAG: CPBP family intramembrane glutamic endopeptidase [Chlamydiota bacterium]
MAVATISISEHQRLIPYVCGKDLHVLNEKIRRIAFCVFSASYFLLRVGLVCFGYSSLGVIPSIIYIAVIHIFFDKKLDDVTTSKERWVKIARDVGLGVLFFLIEMPISSLINNTLCNFLIKKGIDLHSNEQVCNTVLDDVIDRSMGFFGKVAIVDILAEYCFFGPILEEKVFRGCFCKFLHKEMKIVEGENLKRPLVKRICAVALNAILFGLYHLDASQGWLNLPIFVGTAIGGAFLATLREITGGVVASSTSHILWNSLVIGSDFTSG